MERRGWLAIALGGLVILLGVWVFTFREKKPEFESEEESPEQPLVTQDKESAEEALVSMKSAPEKPEYIDIRNPRLLRDYGSEGTTAKDDMELVVSTLKRFWLLFKDPDLLRVGSNEEIVETLAGRNPEGIAFISPDNPFIDDQGRLTDRWGTPVFFHPISMINIEIRSAGPDREMFTDDDILLGTGTRAVPRH